MLRIQCYFAAILLMIIRTTSTATNNDNSRTLMHVNHLQNRIQKSIDTLNTRIPRLSNNLNSNIQRISTKTKVPSIISALENQISDGSECGFSAKNFINSLKFSSKADISDCREDAVVKGANVLAQATVLLKKATDVRNDCVGRVGTCVKSNVANEVTLALCLVGQVFPIEESLKSLEEEVESTLGVCEQTAQDVIVGLIQCVSSYEDVIEDESKKILNRYISCKTSKGG